MYVLRLLFVTIFTLKELFKKIIKRELSKTLLHQIENTQQRNTQIQSKCYKFQTRMLTEVILRGQTVNARNLLVVDKKKEWSKVTHAQVIGDMTADVIFL